MLLAIVSAAILSRYFDKVEYGTYRQIVYVYTSLVVIFSAGLPNIFSYFLPKIGRDQGRDLVNKVTYLLIGLGLLFSIFLWIGAPWIAKFFGNTTMIEGLRKFAIVPVLLLPTLGLDGIFASYQQTHLLAIYNTLNRILMLGCIVVPVIWIENSADMAINGWILASVLNFILAIWFRNLPFKGVSSSQSMITSRAIFGYSIPLVTASLWGMAIRYADQFYISNYFGPEVYAEFSNGFIEIPLTAVLTGSIATILTPMFAKNSINENGKMETLLTWRRVLEKSAIILYPIVIFLMVFGKEIMIFVYSKNYEKSGIYFQINTILNIFNIVTFTPILYAYGKVKFYSNLHMIFAIIAWVIGYILVSTVRNPVSIAIMSTSIQILFIFISMWMVLKILQIKVTEIIPFRLLFKIIASCVVSALIVKLAFACLLQGQLFILTCGILYLALLLTIWSIFKINFNYILEPILTKLNNKKYL